MANRKYRHNANVVRTSVNVNGDLNGLEDLFMFTIDMGEDLSTGEPRFNIENLFGSLNADTDNYQADEVQFNYGIRAAGTNNKLVCFRHDGVAIDSINAPYAAVSNNTRDIDSGVINSSETGITIGDAVEVYIKGQFNTLAYYPGINDPEFGENTAQFGEGLMAEEYVLEIKQWGKSNTIKNWNKFLENGNSNYITIEATDEPKFNDSYCYKAFKGAGDVFSTDAIASVNSWDTEKMTRLGRMFEGAENQGVNIDKWTMNGGVNSTDYMFYMRNSSDWITNKGANMVPKGMVGWAGYASESFSDSFQGATGIHNWENVNSSQAVDMQYFAWKNTRAKSLGTMRNLITSKVENFTAMFGYAGLDSYGAEGELLIDPSNWDMSSAKTLFYMMATEGGDSSWAGELNWKSMKNVIDIHSVVKNRNNYTGARLDEFAPYSGNVVLFRSAFAGTGINYDFRKWDFSGVDATRTDVQLNENNASGIMGGFVRDCVNMSYENILNLLVALGRPFGQGGLPVLGVDAQIGTAAQTIDFGTLLEAKFDNGGFDSELSYLQEVELRDPETELSDAKNALTANGYAITGLDNF